MDTSNSTTARQLAQAASAFEQQRTGHAPKSVTVVLSEDTLVITLRGALSPAETALARSPAGAAEMQELYRQLFASAADGWIRRPDLKPGIVERFRLARGLVGLPYGGDMDALFVNRSLFQADGIPPPPRAAGQGCARHPRDGRHLRLDPARASGLAPRPAQSPPGARGHVPGSLGRAGRVTGQPG